MEVDAIDRAIDAAENALNLDEDGNSTVSETPNSTKFTEQEAEDVSVKQALDKTVKKEKPSKEKPTPFKAKAKKEEVVEEEEVLETEAKEPAEDLSDQEASVEILEGSETEGEPLDTTPPEIPTFWSAELKKAAAEAPRAVVEAFAKHDAQREEWARRIANEAQRSKAIEKRLYEGFEPIKDEAIANGINNPIDELERYRAFDRVLKKDPRRFLSDLGRKNGISPDEYAAAFYGEENEAHSEQAQKDPRIDEVINKIQTWEKKQEESSLRTEINTFKQGTDSLGNVRKTFAETYAPQIEQAYLAVKNIQPELPMQDALSHAYEYVMAEIRKLHGITPQPPSRPKPPISAPQSPGLVKKAKSAASSVVGAPSSNGFNSRSSAKSIDEAMDRAEEILASR